MRNNVAPFDGSGYGEVVSAPNPDGVVAPPVALAADDLTGRIYWVQPQGGSASLGSTIRSANGDGSDNVEIVGGGLSRTSLLVDSIKGHLLWTENGAIKRSNLDGSGVTEVRAAVSGQEVQDLALDPYAQKLYWIDPSQQSLFQANSDGSGVAAIATGLDGGARGVALRPLDNELYYSSGNALFRAGLDGSSPVTVTTFGGQYQGPSNLQPDTFPYLFIGTPDSSLVVGQGSPILSPCTLADPHEPNNSSATATSLTVASETVIYGALCNATVGQPSDLDHYAVTVASGKVLTATLTQLPADYRLVIIHPQGYAAAFSDNPGLAGETGTITNTSSVDQVYTVLVLSGFPVQNVNQYKLTLTLGDVPPPPDPTDEQCGAVDIYDAPGTGNGTLATATPLTFGTPYAAALCYTADVDMYAFDGLADQSISLDLPTRPQDYDLTLYDPSGAVTTVISSTTSPAYGGSVTLPSSGRYTVAVSQPDPTPTDAQYQLLVTDQNCMASDANEPNNTQLVASPVGDGSRVRATLCSGGDVDYYAFSAAAGQQLTLNYPANATGASLRVFADGGGDLGQVTTGSQGIFTIPSTGQYFISVQNAGLSGSNVSYLFQMLLGTATVSPTGSAYIYHSRVNDFLRAEIATGTVEPVLTGLPSLGGVAIATDPERGWLFVLDFDNRLARVNFDGTGRVNVVENTNPNNMPQIANALAVDEHSHRIYWIERTNAVLSRILSADENGNDVQEINPQVVDVRGLAVDSVAGQLYWAKSDLYNGNFVDMIQRSNLDGSHEETVYAAPLGRQIRELALNPFGRKFYWRDPSQNRLVWMDMDGSGNPDVLATVDSGARGFVVRPLQNELYYSDRNALRRSALDGSAPQVIAQFGGEYNGVSNVDANVFYPTTLTPPHFNMALGYSQPFAQPCTAVDAYEPNNTAETAASIGVGTIHASLCTQDLANIDSWDYYSVTVAAGKQITVALTDLFVDYGMNLLANGRFVNLSNQPGQANEILTHINTSGSPTTYTFGVFFAGTSGTRLPYTLTVTVADAPPPPPPPPPPPDVCAPFDVYDHPGVAGNQTRQTATSIAYNTPITAALCYQGDKDFYAFDGVLGQNVIVNLSPRPVDYYVYFYGPDGQFVAGIYPGSLLQYGGTFTLNATGRWTVGIWHTNLVPTTDQYTLELGFDSDCFGKDPYEPNDDQFSPTQILTPTVTIRSMLCKDGAPVGEQNGDLDFYGFPVLAGQRVRMTPALLSPDMNLMSRVPGYGYVTSTDPVDAIAIQDGNFIVGVYANSGQTADNLPYGLDVQIDPVPTPTPQPNNWSCTIYPSTDIPVHINDLATFASTVNVPANGTITHVGIKDLTFNHGALYSLSFGLTAPDGTSADLFDFNDYGFYTWCGEDASHNPVNCRLSIDDGAIAGLAPPQFPNNGGTFRPSRSSFAPFNGKQSSGTWSLLVADDSESDVGGDAGDTTGDLFAWSLEVCIDNGQTPTPAPTPTPSSTPVPQPGDGAPNGATTSGDTTVATPTPTTCTPTVDAYEPDNSALTASLFDVAGRSSAGHTFHSINDADWMTMTLTAGLQYTLTAKTANGAQRVSLALYDTDGTTPIGSTRVGQLVFSPTASGTYYLRTTSASGLTTNLCLSGYSIALSSGNPNATPVPTPTGTPVPASHVAPPLSVAVLLPTDGTVLTQTQMIALAVGLNAENDIAGAELLVNDASLAVYAASGNDKDLIWQTGWTPTQAGAYALTAVITDSLGVTATSSGQYGLRGPGRSHPDHQRRDHHRSEVGRRRWLCPARHGQRRRRCGQGGGEAG